MASIQFQQSPKEIIRYAWKDGLAQISWHRSIGIPSKTIKGPFRLLAEDEESVKLRSYGNLTIEVSKTELQKLFVKLDRRRV